ncbi:hypothetical protein D0439_10105 [Lysinibacillus fusiformis]|uniref:hypothetical protein n=1 Tax=Lysinibacillus fusiformis TaxID=28031 RepID=UPI00088BA160|nr:hypothetical protein [Lysinibacillus fusiformis]QDZ98963.1 hypothetical protein D0439_10105 [Lysinibacillus fusiformis]SCX52087.1 hypothetical protein SAMN02787108_01866 [Lysinibacillus fusiformis]SDB27708.1 hypothetical protein SAMN02787070_01996 [Lysinibacillus fusiformis]SFI21921.1 hypothetical protein SAMN02787080_01995 [Lysinibacillus fusiformis]SFS82145.1 hypothetical protein SAMN02787099_01730 [Lysinibacillus fusiformis]
MNSDYSKQLVTRFEEVSKTQNRFTYNDQWLKVKNWIGENRIEFLYVDDPYSENNRTTVITKDSVIEIKMNYVEELASSHLTTPIQVKEFKKKVKEKNYLYKKPTNWEVTFVYDDGEKIKISSDSMIQCYLPNEINEEMFIYLINL